MRKYHIGIGTVSLLAAFCVLLYGAVRYNLAAATAAIERMSATVVIDAGHGGEDGGTTGSGGASESRINLEIAQRLEQLLAFCGQRTMMIRTSDTAVYTGECETLSEKKVSDLKNRVAMVNRAAPAVLVSLHQNHFPQEQYSGAQVFYAKTDGSRELAQSMQEMLRISLNPNNHRASKPASSVYLMEHIQCTGVLVECGFLSNREEEVLLQQPEYQKKIVCAITGALIQETGKGETDREV